MTRAKTSLKKSDLHEGKPIRIDIGSKALLLVMVNGEIYAMDAVCTHEGGPLEEGTVEDHRLTCPWHQAVFDLRTAKVSPETAWATDLNSYKVNVDNNTGELAIDTNPNTQSSGDIKDSQDASLQDSGLQPSASKLQLKLLEKFSHQGTDAMSFKFSRNDEKSRTYLEFKAGQFSVVDLGTKEDSKGPTRSFTIASSPTERDSLLITTRIRDSPFKQKLAGLEPGIAVNIMAPGGQFILPDEYSRPLVFLSGGIGVTPFRSMIKYATDKQLPLKIVMFDSNRNEANILYKGEFDSWAKLNNGLNIVYTITDENRSESEADWNGERGKIDKKMLTKHLTKDDLEKSIFYVCGPPQMLEAMRKLLVEEMSVAEDKVKIEEFTGY
jgi:ferredoxin-NADP reductase/nitrite reductase/ring-hydroxylating ferredoxin subunit